MSEVVIESIEEYGLSSKDRPKTLFSKVGIVGCGAVGQTIAQMISCRGIEVIFLEVSEEKIQQAIQEIEKELDQMIARWGMTSSDKRSIMSRIKGTLSYSDLKDCDLVVEAILSNTRERYQSVELRKDVFRKIEEVVAKNAIIATNSTTLIITELSAGLKNKERCVSLHFSTASPAAQVIEVVKGLHTSEEIYESVCKFIKLIHKVVIPVQESPGLISSRLFIPLINEACRILMENVGNKEDIDLTMRTSLGTLLGPFEMADKIGLDKILRWMENLYNEFGDLKYKASPLIKRLVRANHLGRKTGEGFYKYNAEGKKIN